ncbi:MAG: domain 2 [Verrucomicrobiota bacterium]
MGEEWIVRVEGREYGPVGTDDLREWRREGRLIPANELRRVGDGRWICAGELPEIFGDVELAASPPPPPRDFESPRTWRQIFEKTFRIYRRGFARFMLFGLLTSVPMFVLQWTLPKIPFPDLASGSYTFPSQELPPICLVMFVLLLLAWPVSAAGFQFVADDILRGRARSLGVQFSAALRCWVRMFAVALLVYGSYFFWFFVPLAAMIAFIGIGNPLLASLMILLIGGFMVYMNARLFINFLFWQQTAALGTHPPLAALRESKELARSVPEAPRLDRPLYRGAIIASVWLLLLLGLTFGLQLPFMMVRLAGLENPEEAMALVQKMAQSQTPDALMIAADVATAVMNLLLRPLLGAAFVVLYYDAKTRSGRMNNEEVSPET